MTTAAPVKIPSEQTLMSMNKEALVAGLQKALNKANDYKAQALAAAICS